MMLRQSGTFMETISLGSSRAGMPSSRSANSKACRNSTEALRKVN